VKGIVVVESSRLIADGIPIGEVCVTDPDTGGQKGMKLARYDLIPAHPLEALANHYGIGALKYEEGQWRKGYKFSLSFAAMMRHGWAFWRGEDIDPETGSPHLAAVAWHAFALMEFVRTHPEKDDRPEQTLAQTLLTMHK
jgi:hypothetical protein